MAREHQNNGPLQPLSMVSMFTPRTVAGTSEEIYFRRRAVELAEELDSEVLWEDAVVTVVGQLVQEGLCVRISDINEDVVSVIVNQIGDFGRSRERTALIRGCSYIT